METEHSPFVRRLLGGHLALDFANTVDDPLGPGRCDTIPSYADLVDWASAAQAAPAELVERLAHAAERRRRAATAALRRAHELRDILNDVFGAVADRSGTAAEHWARLRPFVTDAYRHAELDTTGPDSRRWSWTNTDDLAVILHPVALAAADLLVSDELYRLKRCSGCPWLFLDSSKNHSRRWCAMDSCGRAQKIERYVARRAARRASTDR